MIKQLINDWFVGALLFIFATLLLIDQGGASSSQGWIWMTLVLFLMFGEKCPSAYRWAFPGVAVGLVAEVFWGGVLNWIESAVCIFFAIAFLLKFFVERKCIKWLRKNFKLSAMNFCFLLFLFLTFASLVVMLFHIGIFSNIKKITYLQEALVFLPGFSIGFMVLLCSIQLYRPVFIIVLPAYFAGFISATHNIYSGVFLFPSIQIASWVTVALMVVNVAGLYFWYMDYSKNDSLPGKNTNESV
ncbi:hypothetical protein [Piscirickettsia litoralis]|nr:hypothetical protein [Piscirickettsia litoralis]